MKLFKRIFLLSFILTAFTSLSAFAAGNTGDIKLPKIPVPSTELKNEDRTLDYRWTWLKDNLCVRYKIPMENITKDELQEVYNTGAISLWSEWDTKNMSNNWVKVRDTYTGKWSQSAAGIRSFTFDDCTIPVGVTKIDGVLYAFNSYGELKEGYEYYTGFKTEADGLVKADSAEFTQWLTTQYLPECTSHE